MKLRPILCIGAIAVATVVEAGSEVKGSATVQFTKKALHLSSGNLDGAWVRGELKASTKVADDKAGGLLHVRIQSNTGNKALAIYLQQAFWDISASILTFRGGRWYDYYTPGYYFGRYLHGVKAAGSGSMNTNYTVVDGLRGVVGLDAAKTNIHLAVLPTDLNFETVYTMLRVESNPIEQLNVNLSAKIQTTVPEGTDRTDLMSLALSFEIIENLMPFVEVGMPNLQEVGDNVWIMAGLDIPTGGILDRLRIETETKSDRATPGERDQFAWMLLLRKKVKGLTFDCNIGADPKGLSSANPGDVGCIFRMAAGF